MKLAHFEMPAPNPTRVCGIRTLPRDYEEFNPVLRAQAARGALASRFTMDSPHKENHKCASRDLRGDVPLEPTDEHCSDSNTFQERKVPRVERVRCPLSCNARGDAWEFRVSELEAPDGNARPVFAFLSDLSLLLPGGLFDIEEGIDRWLRDVSLYVDGALIDTLSFEDPTSADVLMRTAARLGQTAAAKRAAAVSVSQRTRTVSVPLAAAGSAVDGLPVAVGGLEQGAAWRPPAVRLVVRCAWKLPEPPILMAAMVPMAWSEDAAAAPTIHAEVRTVFHTSIPAGSKSVTVPVEPPSALKASDAYKDAVPRALLFWRGGDRESTIAEVVLRVHGAQVWRGGADELEHHASRLAPRLPLDTGASGEPLVLVVPTELTPAYRECGAPSPRGVQLEVTWTQSGADAGADASPTTLQTAALYAVEVSCAHRYRYGLLGSTWSEEEKAVAAVADIERRTAGLSDRDALQYAPFPEVHTDGRINPLVEPPPPGAATTTAVLDSNGDCGGLRFARFPDAHDGRWVQTKSEEEVDAERKAAAADDTWTSAALEKESIKTKN